MQPEESFHNIYISFIHFQQAPVLRLQLAKPKNDKKVAWRSGTVDNENMGKKKSKCKFNYRSQCFPSNYLTSVRFFTFQGCCIYKKPLQFGESSSESEDECENCFGHVEKRHKKKGGSSGDDCPDHCDENPDSKSGERHFLNL